MVGKSLSNRKPNRDATLGMSGRPLRWTITAASVTGFSLFGYDQGLMSGIVGREDGLFCDKEFPVLCHHGSDSHRSVLQGGVTSSYEIGCFFGALFVLFYGEKLGRKPLIIAGCIIIIIGAVISTAAFGPHWGLGQFVVGRVITGLGNGMNTATIPVWQSEMARPELRGRLVNLEGSVVAVGTMVAYWLDYGLSFVDSSIQWRLPVAVQIIFAIIVLFLVIGLPESPRWLVAHNRDQEATNITASLLAKSTESDEVIEEVHNIKEDALRQGTAMRFRDLLTQGRTAYFSRMVIGASTQFFQQFTGCNAAIYYSTILFTRMGLEGRLPLLLGAVFACVYALFTLPSFYLIEKIGRRNLFMTGAMGQGISFIITMACLTKPDDRGAQKGAVVGLFLFIAFFGMSILGLPWVYPPEINPLKTRTAATAVSTCTNWLCNFAVVMFTPVFVADAGWGAYLFFALINFIWVPIIFFFYPETAGRSLEEVDIIFARAHEEGRLPFRVAATMPRLDAHEVAAEAQRLGISDEIKGDQEATFGITSSNHSSTEKPSGYPVDGADNDSISAVSVDPRA